MKSTLCPELRIVVPTALLLGLAAVVGCSDRNDAQLDPGAAHGSSAGLPRGGGGGGEEDDGDIPVAFDECPAEVQATIRAHLQGGEITELERTTDHGEVLYEVDVMTASGRIEFDIAADGAFRGYEGDDDDGDDAPSRHGMSGGEERDDDGDDDDDDHEVEVQIPLSEVPEAIRQVALEAVPGIVFDAVAEKETGSDGSVTWELTGVADGTTWEVEVTSEGEVVDIEEEDGEGDDDR